MTALGSIVRSRREQMEVRISQIATRSGIDPVRIDALENDEQLAVPLTDDETEALSRALDWPSNGLFRAAAGEQFSTIGPQLVWLTENEHIMIRSYRTLNADEQTRMLSSVLLS